LFYKEKQKEKNTESNRDMWEEDKNDIFLICPHCQGPIIVAPKDINCRIFRHGIFRSTGQPIPPHSTKEECEEWSRTNQLWGCGKPFQLFQDYDITQKPKRIIWKTKICDYI